MEAVVVGPVPGPGDDSGGGLARLPPADAAVADDRAAESTAARDADSVAVGAAGTSAQGGGAVVRSGGGRLYAAFLVLGAVAVCGVALLCVLMLVAAFPGTAAAAESASATALRVAYWALFVGCPQAVMIMGPFSWAFVMDQPGLVRRASAVAAAWAVVFTFSEMTRPGLRSTLTIVLLVCWTIVFVPTSFLPLWLVGGLEKRGEASARTPTAKWIIIGVVFCSSIVGLLEYWIPGAYVGFVLCLIPALFMTLLLDDPKTTYLSEWYLVILVVVTYSVPLAVFALVVFLVDGLDQTDPLESLATSLALVFFIFLVFQFQYAFARRALPARHRAIALFPLQVFEDVFAEFFFANARVYSGGFFVLLAVQVVRTLGRDTGTFNEARRMCGNWWRARRGEPPVARRDDAVVEWTRIWLQNMVSELTAMFVFVGAIAGEELRGDEIGPLTDLDHGDRIALLGGYGVVFLFEAAAHLVCFAVLRRVVQTEQARLAAYALEGEDRRATVAALRAQGLSIGAEARKLVRRHGLYLVATLLAVTSITFLQIRLLRIDYDD